MAEHRRTFAARYLAGEIRPEDAEGALDDEIDLWHDLPDTNYPPLHEYLGLTADEYRSWVQESKAIVEIMAARRG